MSVFRALEYVRDRDTHRGLTPGASALLIALATFVGKDGSCEPSVYELAGMLNVSEANVRRRRVELVNAGLIRVDMRGGRHRPNRYVFPFAPVLAAAPEPDPDEMSTTRAVPRGFTEPANGITRAETRAETRAVPRDQGQGQGEVLTSTDGSGARRADLSESDVPPTTPQPVPAWVREAMAAGGMRR